jgi:hypothetical protein
MRDPDGGRSRTLRAAGAAPGRRRSATGTCIPIVSA